MLMVARGAILAAKSRDYPICLETHLTEQKGENKASNFQQLINWLNLNLNYFDYKLLTAEWEMFKNGDYSPTTGKATFPDGRRTTQIQAEAMFNYGRDNQDD